MSIVNETSQEFKIEATKKVELANIKSKMMSHPKEESKKPINDDNEINNNSRERNSII